MNGKPKSRPVKLILNKETLRQLDQQHLSRVRGGGDISSDCHQDSFYICTETIPAE